MCAEIRLIVGQGLPVLLQKGGAHLNRHGGKQRPGRQLGTFFMKNSGIKDLNDLSQIIAGSSTGPYNTLTMPKLIGSSGPGG